MAVAARQSYRYPKSLLKDISLLVSKEFRIDLRSRGAIGGILLYIFSTVFVVYTGFVRLQVEVWNVQFWIIVLFASVQAVYKSLALDSGSRQIYLYTLFDPYAVILSKLIYNALWIFLICVLTFVALSFFTIQPVKFFVHFLGSVFLGSFGFSVVFTFVAAIAYRATQQTSLMSILGFPLILPVLLVLIKLSSEALGLIQDSAVWSDYAMLAGTVMLLVALCIILFPSIWRD